MSGRRMSGTVRAATRCKNLTTQDVLDAVLDSDSEDYVEDRDNDPDFNISSSSSSSSSSEEELPNYKQNDATNTEDIESPAAVCDSTGDSNKKERSRKRTVDASSWKRNVRSKNFNSGFKTNGTEDRQLGPPCEDTCKLKCKETYSENDRLTLLHSFWSMNDHQRRRDFVISHVKRFLKKRSTSTDSSRRANTLHYFLPKEDGQKTHVCKVFFLNTLRISDFMVKYNLDNSVSGMAVNTPTRVPANKTSVEQSQRVTDHINSFPRVESHYCRADSNRSYLDPSLNITQLYRLYVSKCAEEHVETCSEYVYRSIFNTHFNLGFHKPSKDQCDTCAKFQVKEMANILDDHDRVEFEAHMRRKIQAREAKHVDKSIHNGEVIAAAFDLQQVMSAPKSNVGSAYYLRKMNVYNFTIIELQTHQGYCYTWHEGEAKRGANEIGTMICKWLHLKDEEGYTHVILYSDSCGGQNRNRIMATAIVHFLDTSVNVKTIEQKFFESGHSQNECDSMHSCIEREYKHLTVNLPSEYQKHMLAANKRNTYKVTEIVHDDIIDYDNLNLVAFKQNAFSGIISVHHIVYDGTDRTDIAVFFSDEIGGDLVRKPYKKRGNLHNLITRHAYVSKLKIDPKKKNDLQKMCQFLPSDCRPFYENLQIEE